MTCRRTYRARRRLHRHRTGASLRRFGSRVTIIEPGPQIMGREDPDVTEEIARILGGEGIDVLAAPTCPCRWSEWAVRCRPVRLWRADDRRQSYPGCDRPDPNTADIGLDKAEMRWTRTASSRSTRG